MELIGYMDSPFVRRVAVSAKLLGLPFKHRELSIFRDFEEFRAINPLVKVPTFVCDDGQILVDSTLIIDYLESVAGKSLMPSSGSDRTRALNIIGIAIVAMEKVAQLIYETKQRPEEVQYQPWIDRLQKQLSGALDLLEDCVGEGSGWFFGDELSQADLTVAIAWRFVQHILSGEISPDRYQGLVVFSERAERLPEFKACPLS